MLFCTNYVLLAQLRSAPASCPYTEKLRLHRRQQPSDGRTLTPADANQFGWQVQWSAVTGRYDLVTQSYSFNGQRIAQRKDGVLTYLHADQVGSTLLATAASGAVVGNNQPRYFAYGRERTPSLAALPTDYTYTGQKQDGSGLVYMNARYYDPVIGQFISADTVVPDPTNLFSYNRFMYVNGNPLRYNDPSGHASPTAGALPQPDTWQTVIDTINLAANNGAAIVGPVLAAAPMGTVAAVVLGGGAYGLAHTTDALPSVPALYPNLGVGNGNISITIPVPGSTTTTSGVPLTPGAQTQSTGATAVNQPAQNIIEPLPAQQQGGNIVFSTNFNTGTLQHEWGHAKDFGLFGNWNKANGNLFQKTLENFIDNAPEQISGTFRGTIKVTHYYDQATRLWVAVDAAGNYIASWKLSVAQEQNLRRNGNVQ